MAELGNKRCPQCGRRPLDIRLVQCPDCHVPFEYDAAPPALTPAQLAEITRQIFKSGRFWFAFILLLVLLVASGMVLIHFTGRNIALGGVAPPTQSQIAEMTSGQVSNQVAAAFRDPKIQATIEEVATRRASEIMTNAIWPSLENFRTEMRIANDELAKRRGDLAVLSNGVHSAQIAASHILNAVSNTSPFLELVDQGITRSSNNFVLTLYFRPSNDNPVGEVELAAGTYRQTAKILSFTARNVSRVEPPIINDIGDAADLKFTAGRVDAPIIVELVLTDATIVRIVGDSLEQELTLYVAADQMRLPRASR